MSKHLFGSIVTHHGTAANNRGETEGNITTLQKILWNDDVHTTVSAEAIRFAIRWYWQFTDKDVNRFWEEAEGETLKEKPSHAWNDHTFKDWQKYIDDDVLGFMSTEAGKEEVNTEEETGRGKRRSRGKALVRRARLEVTRAVSLTPFAGDITFNAASIGATPSASRTGKDPVPYGTEVHATRYQYGFALTPEDLHRRERALDVVDAIVNLAEVAGNQARFLFDFSPESVVLRWTDDFAPRILYSFRLGKGMLGVPEIVHRVDAGDIEPKELVIGGSIAESSDGKALEAKGAKTFLGVKNAGDEAKNRMYEDLKLS